MAVKRIPLETLKIGMYVTGFDRPWIETPYLQQFLIRTQSDIEKLRQCGVREADIDATQGLDVESEDKAQEPQAEPVPEPDPAPTTVPEPSPEPAPTPEPPPVVPAPEPPPQVAPPAEKPETPPPPPKVEKAHRREFVAAKGARQKLLEDANTAFEKVRSEGVVESKEMKGMAQDMTAKVLNHPAAFLALIRTRQEFDPVIREHLFTVCTLALLIGKTLGYDNVRLERLATGAMLHDIGLLRLPPYLVRLSQSLSKHERSLYESHPRLGVTMLLRSGGFQPEILRILDEHHVTPDHSGYPKSIPWNRTAEASRIVMVVDRYHELLTGEADQPALPSQQALSQLYQEARANHLDLTIVSHLIGVVGVYPLYSMVTLNTGERGIVTAIMHGKLHQPVVTLIQDTSGNPYRPPQTIDLSDESPGTAQRSIIGIFEAEEEGFRIEDYLPNPVSTEDSSKEDSSEVSPEPVIQPNA